MRGLGTPRRIASLAAPRLRVCPVTLFPALFATGAAAQESDADDLWNFDELEEIEPGFLEIASGQLPDLLLFGAFAALAMLSFFLKSKALKYLTLVVCVAYMGIAKSQLITIRNIFSTLTAELPIFSYSLAFYAFAGFTVVTTVLWGRIYCGRVCAFGALTQLIDAVVPQRLKVDIPAALERRAAYIKYAILFAAVAVYLVTRESAFYQYIEPFWMFSLRPDAATPILWGMLAVLLIASIFVRNLYCRFLCPLGAALGLLSKLTVFRIKRWSECNTCQLCENVCEWGAIRNRQIVMTECVRCDDCERLYDDKAACPHWLLIAKRERLGRTTGQAAGAHEVAVPVPPVRKN